MSLSADLNRVITEEDIKALRSRNIERAKEAILKLGRKYVLHPQNHVRKVPAKQLLTSQ